MRVIFVFSHPVLFRVWPQVVDQLQHDNIQVDVVSQMAPLDWDEFIHQTLARADAVYLDISRHFPSFDALVAGCPETALLLPGGVEAAAALPEHDAALAARIADYLKAGGATDLAHAVRCLLHAAGALDQAPPPPAKPLLCGIYHSGAEQPFSDWATYNAWLKESRRDTEDKPVVMFCFGRSSVIDGNTELADAVFNALEAQAFQPVCVFCDWNLAANIGNDPGHPLARLLAGPGARLTAVWNNLFTHTTKALADGDSPFRVFGVPVFQVVRNYTSTVEDWLAQPDGLSAMSICYSLTQPEMLGCIEPTVLACNRKTAVRGLTGEVNEAVPVPERIAMLAARTRRWHVLRTRPNAEKNVAIMLHNAPCKGIEGSVGTAGALDATESAVRILHRLRDEGYRVEQPPADGAALHAMIMERKALSEFRWTSVEEIAARGGALAYIDETTYRRDFDNLPQDIRADIDRAWEPFPGKAMVHPDPNGRPSLLVSGLRFGNVLVLVEPKRGCWGPKCDGEVCRILHEPDIPPTHQWLATYWFLQREVDALVVMGAESPVEYLPGKRAGLSERCFPEITLGALPVIYPFLMSGTAAGLMAKRRGHAVLVDHLTAPQAHLGTLDTRWAELEELHRQHDHAAATRDKARMNQIRAQLTGLMRDCQLLDNAAAVEMVTRRIDELPRRLEQMRRRMTDVGLHVLGRAPDKTLLTHYTNELHATGATGQDALLRERLAQTPAEMDTLVTALNGRFVAPGPSGQIVRGKIDALPTGRNFYGIDLAVIPTPAACEVGAAMGRQLLLKHLDEEGAFPQSIGIVLWSSDAFRADGELTAQILWLLGCRPHRVMGGRVRGVEALPIGELTMTDAQGHTISRPRVDVVVQMSGIVRDTLPNIYGLLDEAVAFVAALDEPAEVNYVRAHVESRMNELARDLTNADNSALRRLASLRVFSSKPGSYGVGVDYAVDASAWQDDRDLAEAFVNWTGHAYGKRGAEPMPVPGRPDACFAEYAKLMGGLDATYQRASGSESDALSIGCYAAFQGGMATVGRALGNKAPRMYWGDTVSGAEFEVRGLEEELDMSFATKLLNQAWLAARKQEGYRGASSVAAMVNTAFHWSATAHAVNNSRFDAICAMYVENEENRAWLARYNVHALEEISRRLLEASSRGLWQADETKLEALKQTVLHLEGDIEERMGPVQGEFQGGSVDIKTRDQVKEWSYMYRLK